MPYSADDIDHFEKSCLDWSQRLVSLLDMISTKAYKTDKGREYALHGFCRRMSTLRHCLDRTFETIPMDECKPSVYQLQDATIFVQAFIFNVFGAIDNLAHVWCNEACSLIKNGRPITLLKIGLLPNNKEVRSTFSVKFQSYLRNYDDWFEYLEGYRHALAHRIPLYIPTRQMDPTASAKYKRLEAEWHAAIFSHEYRRADQVFRQMQDVGTFEPFIMHSFYEGAIPMRFHAQMICDFATIIEIGEHMVEELKRVS